MGLFVGVDPGAKGSLCFLNMKTREASFLPTPCLTMSSQDLLKEIMATHEKDSIYVIAIENVHSIFGVSAGSNFTFGYNVGLINGLLEATGIGVERVDPKEWQRTIKAPSIKQAGSSAKHKKAIAEIALRLYPNAPLFGPRGGLIDGRADSLMIAHSIALKYGAKL